MTLHDVAYQKMWQANEKSSMFKPFKQLNNKSVVAEGILSGNENTFFFKFFFSKTAVDGNSKIFRAFLDGWVGFFFLSVGYY